MEAVERRRQKFLPRGFPGILWMIFRVLFSPSCRRHHEQARRLRLGIVDVPEISRGGPAGFRHVRNVSSCASYTGSLNIGRDLHPYWFAVIGMNCHIPLAYPNRVFGPTTRDGNRSPAAPGRRSGAEDCARHRFYDQRRVPSPFWRDRSHLSAGWWISTFRCTSILRSTNPRGMFTSHSPKSGRTSR